MKRAAVIAEILTTSGPLGGHFDPTYPYAFPRLVILGEEGEPDDKLKHRALSHWRGLRKHGSVEVTVVNVVEST